MEINTLAELKEFANSDEGKAVIASFVDESGYKTADDIAGLERKKNELLEKVAKANGDKKTITELYDKYGIIDSDDLAAKLATLADAGAKGSELEKLQRRFDAIERAAKQAEERAASEKALRAESEKRSQILSGLKEAHVNDESIDVLIPYFERLVKAEEGDGGKISLVVDTDAGPSPFKSYVQDWSKTDKAKTFIKAPANKGGGSGGPGGDGMVMTEEQIAAMPNRKDRLEAMAKLAATG